MAPWRRPETRNRRGASVEHSGQGKTSSMDGCPCVPAFFPQKDLFGAKGERKGGGERERGGRVPCFPEADNKRRRARREPSARAPPPRYQGTAGEGVGEVAQHLSARSRGERETGGGPATTGKGPIGARGRVFYFREGGVWSAVVCRSDLKRVPKEKKPGGRCLCEMRVVVL